MNGDRWYRRLLRLLPFDMRSDYGGAMEQVFREERRDARRRGAHGAVLAWMHAVGDVLAIGPREHAAQMAQDVRYTLRNMRRQAGFAVVAVVTLALGIGANTAIFSVVHAVMLAPLPYGQPEALASVTNHWPGSARGGMSDPEYLDYAERSRSAPHRGDGGRGDEPRRRHRRSRTRHRRARHGEHVRRARHAAGARPRRSRPARTARGARTSSCSQTRCGAAASPPIRRSSEGSST